MSSTISGSGSISGSASIGIPQAPPSIASGTTISSMRFNGGMDSDTVELLLYSEDQTTYPQYNDFTAAMGIAIQNAIDTNQSLQITISGVTDSSPESDPEVTIPYSWFNGTHLVTLPNFGTQDFYKLVFGLRNDLNIPNLPAGIANYNARESITNVTWAINNA